MRSTAAPRQRSRALLVCAVRAAAVCALLVGQTACTATTATTAAGSPPASSARSRPPSATAGPASSPPVAVPTLAPSAPLRALGDRVGLRIGTAVTAPELADGAYRSLIAAEFSAVTPENQMKWKRLEPVRGAVDWRDADAVVDFAAAHGELVRGHTLVWHRSLPAWLLTGVDTGSISRIELRRVLKQHIQDEVAHFRGRIWQWDVVNEVFSDPGLLGASAPSRFWVDHLGSGVLADAFRWAHEADPKALLFYNDYGIEGIGTKSTAVLAWATRLKAQGVPIDGVGFQAHLDAGRPVPEDVTANLRRFADAGFRVAITEADVRTRTGPGAVNTPVGSRAVVEQGAVWRRLAESCLAVRACISFTTWGVSDDRSWVPWTYTAPQQGAALLWDGHLRRKPQAAQLADALATGTGARR
ncbi:endo-1,4-beta-xylanase [Amnibacterium sp. CER49]|uniref:endo-1,4-beta-xylanase n=1 Tax=Amnibacterium sp. CER49 TaxID=3039161 RepID=UPI0024496A0F|nr:endo-1,4-beta-xylanase [Amnibacterium sp. CER49]MDH2444639.1 endo-1,4-beta-xylanase [Amnibacterium sp. CER49]